MLEGVEQRVLCDLFGVLRLAAHQPAIVEHLRAEVLHEALERFGLSRQNRARQVRFSPWFHATIVAWGFDLRATSITAKGYEGVARFDEAAGTFTGEVLNTRDVVAFQGASVKELKRAFQESVDGYLEFCASPGEPG